jgi:outer membrane protein assembly factor BamB
MPVYCEQVATPVAVSPACRVRNPPTAEDSMQKSALLLTGLLLLGSAAVAADWPQWRGPNRDDVSRETGLLKSWPKDGPKLVWTFRDAGLGFATPSVVGDRLYTQGGDGTKEYVLAVELKTPKKAWATAVGEFFKNSYGDGPRGTPTVDGALIYAIGGQGNLLCVKADSGEKVWSKNLRTDFGGEMMSGWGYSESPLVDGNQVICTPGGKKGALVALNKKTGEVIWQSSDFTDKAGYSSVVVSQACGVMQYVQMTGEHVVGIDPKDGHVVWTFARSQPTAAIPTPIVSGDFVFVTSGYSSGCSLLKLAKAGVKLQVEEVYKEDGDYKRITNHHGGVALVDGYLYGYSDGKKGAGPAGWVCQEFKTGKVAWAEDKLGKGSLTSADGHLYGYAEDDGTCVLVEAGPKGWKETGRLTIEKSMANHNGKFWAHPVVANGKLYLRDQDLIHCYEVKEAR